MVKIPPTKIGLKLVSYNSGQHSNFNIFYRKIEVRMVILTTRKCQEMFHFQEKESPEETTEESVKDGV